MDIVGRAPTIVVVMLYCLGCSAKAVGQEEYRAVKQRAWKTYKSEKTQAWAAYQAERDRIWAEYNAEREGTWTAYHSKRGLIWGAYHEERALIWGTYRADRAREAYAAAVKEAQGAIIKQYAKRKKLTKMR